MKAPIVLFMMGLGACGGSSGSGSGGYDSLDLEPPTVNLTVALGGSATQTYQVFGVKNGGMTDLTASCTLRLDINFGSISGPTITVGPHGGVTTVTAVCDSVTGLMGTSQLTVNLTGTVSTGTNTPPNAAGIFGAATAGSDTNRMPSIEYPLDQAIAPLNIAPIEVQWTAAGDDLFHIALSSTYATLDIYTSDLQTALADADWSALAGTAVGEPLSIVVEGLLQATPTTKYAGTPVKLLLSHDTIDKTAIYYWASSQGSIMTETFGDTKPPTVVKDSCTSCHSLSRSGSRLGYSRCPGNDCKNGEWVGFMKFNKGTQMWDDTLVADGKTVNGSYTTFSPIGNPFPDDTQSVAIVSMADGSLALYDPDTGLPVASNLNAVSTHGRASQSTGTMPNWSADGSSIVFASTPTPGQFIDLDHSAIATMTYAYSAGAHTFGEPQLIVSTPIVRTNGTYDSFFFPSFSADGKLIVFNAARDKWRDFGTASAAGQRLMLTDPQGSFVQDLTLLNGGDVDADITWPHWAPGDTNDYYWIVFSSERNYGHEVTAANTNGSCKQNGVQQCKQIWIGAIDRTKLNTGVAMDPSAPPVWLPGQDTQADNISPYWTVPTSEIP